MLEIKSKKPFNDRESAGAGTSSFDCSGCLIEALHYHIPITGGHSDLIHPEQALQLNTPTDFMGKILYIHLN